HAESIGVCTHMPVTELQLSAVHWMPSSQSIGVPGAQRPATQDSTPLHGSPSSHWALVVQGAPKAHPPWAMMQRWPLRQRLSSGTCSQLRDDSTHPSRVHEMPSPGHWTFAPGKQPVPPTPLAAHVSVPLQKTPSSQKASFFVCTHFFCA